ncbi:MAG: Unknown protein [uncultured Aureispira sp.]|uniref:Lipopolysaccharide assembly protein A domain-containing protein n=1 Tax=uncultured Aureispira sp. TaxID=1331704 RepID=A0A6S6UFQ5_9BACT|nr:MAG: Unknown protein [uncultured Aureispira sp.]
MLKKWLFRLKIFVYLLGLIALLIAIFENTTPTAIYFLAYEVTLPLSLWLMGAFLLGGLIVLSFFIFGALPSKWRNNKTKDHPAPIQETETTL